MKRRDKIHLFVLCALLLVYIAAEYAAPKELDWTPSFAPDDRAPFGTLVVTDVLQSAFPGARILTSSEPLFILLRRRDTIPHPFNLLIVNSSLSQESLGMDFSIDPFDTETLLEFVEEGGSVFLAAESFGGALADSLNLKTSIWSTGALDTNVETDFVSLSFANPALHDRSFRVEDRLARWYFSSVDTAHTRIVGTVRADGDTLTNFVKIDRGRGSFLVTTLPYLFTNYALVDSAMAGWSFAALSQLPVRTTVWNANYIPGRGQTSSTPLRYVLANESLRWAWYLAFAGSVLFILFRARRRQRVIPVVAPNRNATLEFADSIGRLYFQRGNHRDLAEKKIAHFFEYVRSHLGIKEGGLDQPVRERIAARAGVPTELLDRIAHEITELRSTRRIDGSELLQLAGSIDEFYKLARR